MNKIVLDKGNSNIDILDKENYNFEIKEDSIINVINEDNLDNKYIFNISENKNLIINILDISEDTKRIIDINLNEKNSSVILNLSSISKKENIYKINVFHNNKNTKSITNLHGLTIDDNSIYFENNGHIAKGSERSVLIQDNKIITIDDNNSKIEPNLFIDEYDIQASHGAYIGKFKEEDIFYLKTRGLSEEKATKLLMYGFLLGEFNLDDNKKQKLIDKINKYWR